MARGPQGAEQRGRPRQVHPPRLRLPHHQEEARGGRQRRGALDAPNRVPVRPSLSPSRRRTSSTVLCRRPTDPSALSPRAARPPSPTTTFRRSPRARSSSSSARASTSSTARSTRPSPTRPSSSSSSRTARRAASRSSTRRPPRPPRTRTRRPRAASRPRRPRTRSRRRRRRARRRSRQRRRRKRRPRRAASCPRWRPPRRSRRYSSARASRATRSRSRCVVSPRPPPQAASSRSLKRELKPFSLARRPRCTASRTCTPTRRATCSSSTTCTTSRPSTSRTAPRSLPLPRRARTATQELPCPIPQRPAGRSRRRGERERERLSCRGARAGRGASELVEGQPVARRTAERGPQAVEAEAGHSESATSPAERR